MILDPLKRSELQLGRIIRGNFLAILSLKILMPSNRIVGVFFERVLLYENTIHMDECRHSFSVNMHDANAIVKNLIPKIFNKVNFH